MAYNTKIPLFRRWVLQNFPFIEQDFDALTDYQLICKVVEYLNKVIETVNAGGEQIELLTNAFNQLQDYVDHYFDNLDVQEEINNKLDQMAEDGQLTTLISAYIDPMFNQKMAEIDAEISEFETDINGRTSSNTTAIQTLSERMDEFTNLPTGSTSGDAELADIRIGYDGNTYTNAGTSVRTQAGKIADDIYEITEETFVQGGINAGTGANSGLSTRIRTGFINENISKIHLDTGYKLALFLWSKEDDSYVGVWDYTNKTIVTSMSQAVYCTDATCYIKDLITEYKIKLVVVHSTDNEPIVPSESSHVTIYVPTVLNGIDNLNTLISISLKDINLPFEQGGINAGTGEFNNYNTRIRTIDFIPSSIEAIKVNTGYKYAIYLYDKDGEYLGVWNGSEIITSIFYFAGDYKIDELQNQYRIKVVGANTVDNTQIPVSDSVNFIFTDNLIIANTNSVKELSEEVILPIHEKESCKVDKSVNLIKSTNTGCCVVTHNGFNELWTFTTGSDDNTTTGNCDKYIINSDYSLSFKETITHNLGHVNSISYNPNTDTLILGNGSGDYDLEGKILILENAYNKTSLNYTDCLVIPFSDQGYKPNAIWGEDNFGNNDIVYVLTNDSHKIVKLQLGSGAKELTNGTIQKQTGYNGTYNIVGTWVWGNISKDYPSVVQGATFIDGKIVWGFGHNVGRIAIRYAELLNDSKAIFGGINYFQYDTDGNKVLCYPCGVSTLGDKLMITNSAKLHVIDEKTL